MIKKEITRYYRSKLNIILAAVLFVLVIGSYYSTYLEKLEWINVLNSQAPDVNLNLVKEIISGYTNLSYFENFIYSPNFFIGFWIIIVIGFDINIGSNTYDTLESNYGTLLMTRMNYAKYLRSIIIARIIYISTFVVGFFIIVLSATIILGKGKLIIPPTTNLLTSSIGSYLLCYLFIILHGLLYALLLILIATVSNVFIKNRYMIRLLPFAIIIATYIFGNTFGNISNFFGEVAHLLVIDSIINSFRDQFTITNNFSILESWLIIGFNGLVLLIIYHINTNKYSEDYILWKI